MRTSWRWTWPTTETGWPSRATASRCRRCPGELAPGHRWSPLAPESCPGSTSWSPCAPGQRSRSGEGRVQLDWVVADVGQRIDDSDRAPHRRGIGVAHGLEPAQPDVAAGLQGRVDLDEVVAQLDRVDVLEYLVAAEAVGQPVRA